MLTLVTLYVVPAASSQCFEQWLVGPDQSLPGVGGWISDCVMWDPDGAGPQQERLVVVGSFIGAGASTATSIAAWDGERWHKMGEFTRASDAASITCVEIFDGQLVVGGMFDAVNSAPIRSLAKWDGVNWTPFGAGLDTESSILRMYSIATYNDELIVSGGFYTAGTVIADGFARWDGSDWHAIDTETHVAPSTMVVFEDELIIGGYFTSVGGVSASRVAAWNGQTWRPLGAGVGTNGTANADVRAFAVHDGALYVGGSFTRAGGLQIRNLARWDGQEWSGVGTLTGSSVNALTSHAGALVAGGSITTADGIAVSQIATWSGSNWSALDYGVQGDFKAIYTLCSDGASLFACGAFEQAGSVAAKGVARWNGLAWTSLGRGFGGPIYAFGEYQSQPIAVGNFVASGSVPANRVAAWDGVAWHSLSSGTDNAVNAAIQYAGDLVVGGEFLTAGGVSARRIARWDGINWSPLAGGLLGSEFAGVRALATYHDELIAGGDFHINVDGVSRGIARWNGQAWQTIGRGVSSGTYASVNSLAVCDNKLIASGQFTSMDGVLANNVASWDGIGWQALDSGLQGDINDTEVLCAVEFQGDLVVAGQFNTAGGAPANNVARWDGAQWFPLADGIQSDESNALVYALYVDGDDLIAAGWFDRAGGIQAHGIARWDGVTWQPFSSGTEEVIYSVRRVGEELWVAGGFKFFGDRASPRWGRWGCPACPGDLNADGGVELGDLARISHQPNERRLPSVR